MRSKRLTQSIDQVKNSPHLCHSNQTAQHPPAAAFQPRGGSPDPPRLLPIYPSSVRSAPPPPSMRPAPSLFNVFNCSGHGGRLQVWVTDTGLTWRRGGGRSASHWHMATAPGKLHRLGSASPCRLFSALRYSDNIHAGVPHRQPTAAARGDGPQPWDHHHNWV